MNAPTTRPSPLRNSKAVNRPFQSPLRSVLSPAGKVDQNVKRLRNLHLHSSPYSKNLTTPEKKTCDETQILPKKICQETKQEETETLTCRQPKLKPKKIYQETKQEETERDEERPVDEADLKRVRDRISVKKQELEHLKRQLLYKKKHESKDLTNLIERWLRGCQEALAQFQKDISQHSGTAMEMTEILTQLGIPPTLVQYSVEDCDFV